ncbi:beta-crystallin B3-like, partial [Pristis pectinata]|uniref:beta-crystallin B3-like n=1 Tax=Pristis pectinata TaxID=685728 RepID=UPI00223DF7B5
MTVCNNLMTATVQLMNRQFPLSLANPQASLCSEPDDKCCRVSCSAHSGGESWYQDSRLTSGPSVTMVDTETKPDGKQEVPAGQPEAFVYKMLIYERENFQGRCLSVSSECRNVCDLGFERIRSARVDCGPWVIFDKSNFEGEMFVLEKGEFPCWDAWSNSFRNDYALSFRPVCMDSREQKICLFEMAGFKGRKMEVSDDDVPSLFSHGFSNRVGSVQVTGGSWVGYEFPGYRGYQFLLEKGEFGHWNQWGARQPQIQSVRRIRDQNWHPHGCFTPSEGQRLYEAVLSLLMKSEAPPRCCPPGEEGDGVSGNDWETANGS